MKKLIILLISVLAVGAVSLILLTHHSDLQVKLSQTLTTDKEDSAAPDEEPVVFNEEITIDFSKGKSFYDEDISVELSCNDPDAVIYYTTDGNDPDETSKKYSEPIAIRAKSDVCATTIKAVAVKDGEKTSIAHK
ncbi:MAG: chitobiase/beta-hexosaminidase C-terminal domain-containing protein, partial [Ruminiclostridium sp.]